MNLQPNEVNAIIAQFRRELPNESATAIAIDLSYSRRSIASFARVEGYVDFVRQLNQAETLYRSRLMSEFDDAWQVEQLN